MLDDPIRQVYEDLRNIETMPAEDAVAKLIQLNISTMLMVENLKSDIESLRQIILDFYNKKMCK